MSDNKLKADKTFSMSQYMPAEMLYKAKKAKAEYYEDMFQRAKAQLESRWQPIETVPKDGTEILVCNMRQGGIKSLISWSRVHKVWKSKGVSILSMQATHWMPPPASPKEK